MNRPSINLLSEYASQEAWELCIREATRSPMVRFGTGAVLLDKSGSPIATGCSHQHDGNRASATTHAEIHCLRRNHKDDLRKATMLLYTLGSSGSASYSSRPCKACAKALVKRGLSQVIYPFLHKGHWSVVEDDLSDVNEDTQLCSKQEGSDNLHYARFNKRKPLVFN